MFRPDAEGTLENPIQFNWVPKVQGVYRAESLRQKDGADK